MILRVLIGQRDPIAPVELVVLARERPVHLVAMSALLNEDPTADRKVLAERSFEIADAMIDAAEKVDEDTSP